jgi:hypothetical protein
VKLVTIQGLFMPHEHPCVMFEVTIDAVLTQLRPIESLSYNLKLC